MGPLLCTSIPNSSVNLINASLLKNSKTQCLLLFNTASKDPFYTTCAMWDTSGSAFLPDEAAQLALSQLDKKIHLVSRIKSLKTTNVEIFGKDVPFHLVTGAANAYAVMAEKECWHIALYTNRPASHFDTNSRRGENKGQYQFKQLTSKDNLPKQNPAFCGSHETSVWKSIFPCTQTLECFPHVCSHLKSEREDLRFQV